MTQENRLTKEERILNILNLDKDSESYGNDIETYRKRYNTIVKELGLKDESIEADEIFKWLHNRGCNLKSLCAKVRGKEELENELLQIFELQREFYEKNLYKILLEEAKSECHSWSDVHICMQENRYKYSIDIFKTSDINVGDLLLGIEDKMEELNNFIDSTLNLIFIQQKNKEVQKVSNIEEIHLIIEEAINVYNKIKNNKESIHNGQNINPYLNLYQYLKSRYIKNFYDISTPDKSDFCILKNENMKVQKKDKYSLKDISNYFTQITISEGLDLKKEMKKSYENMKKSFQSNEEIKKYKENNKYAFTEVSTPIANYLFYSKEYDLKYNRVDVNGKNKVLEYRIKPIVNAYVNNEHFKIKVVFEYIDFINREFENIINAKGHIYQDQMIGFLSETIVNIYYRVIGLSNDSVYKYYLGNLDD
ncbi:hypothetical protein [Paraclostridium sordellii]|uniref:hypothetical protein n=1 Tax=Paraclostridium sordellii TaxID=1505 RepID=UPI000540A5C7|nr:hypothetical protein [Paeniclostridium sordellii]CEK39977.1 hypothetical protein JGS6382_33051 [[Clostridium] sordellii] [Paeniclostridium sordellii]